MSTWRSTRRRRSDRSGRASWSRDGVRATTTAKGPSIAATACARTASAAQFAGAYARSPSHLHRGLARWGSLALRHCRGTVIERWLGTRARVCRGAVAPVHLPVEPGATTGGAAGNWVDTNDNARTGGQSNRPTSLRRLPCRPLELASGRDFDPTPISPSPSSETSESPSSEPRSASAALTDRTHGGPTANPRSTDGRPHARTFGRSHGRADAHPAGAHAPAVISSPWRARSQVVGSLVHLAAWSRCARSCRRRQPVRDRRFVAGSSPPFAPVDGVEVGRRSASSARSRAVWTARVPSSSGSNSGNRRAPADRGPRYRKSEQLEGSW